MASSSQHVRDVICNECHLLNIPENYIERGMKFGACLRHWLKDPFEECVTKGIELAKAEYNKKLQETVSIQH